MFCIQHIIEIKGHDTQAMTEEVFFHKLEERCKYSGLSVGITVFHIATGTKTVINTFHCSF